MSILNCLNTLEITTLLVAFKILYQINDKYGIQYDIYSCFDEFFNCLPFGHILNKKY